MRLPAFVAVQIAFWMAFYHMTRIFKEEIFIAITFIVVIVASMVTTAVYMAGQQK